MKKNRLSIALLSGLLLFSSCDSWLEQEDKMSFTENQAYTSETLHGNVVNSPLFVATILLSETGMTFMQRKSTIYVCVT